MDLNLYCTLHCDSGGSREHRPLQERVHPPCRFFFIIHRINKYKYAQIKIYGMTFLLVNKFHKIKYNAINIMLNKFNYIIPYIFLE